MASCSRWVRWTVSLWLIAACVGGIAAAQDGGADQAAKPATTEAAAETGKDTAAPEEAIDAPQTIPLADVLSRAEAERSRLEEIQKSLETHELYTSLVESLEETRNAIAEQQDATGRVLNRRHGLGELDALRESFRRIENNINSIERDISDRANELEALLLELRSDLTLWTQTQESTVDAQAPAAVLDQISAIVAALDPVITNVETGRNELLALQASAVDQRALITDSYEIIEADRKDLAASLFEAQEPPIWQLGHAYENFDEDTKRAAEKLREQAGDLQAYVQSHRDRLLIHAFLIAALGFGLSRARRSLRRSGEKDSPTLDAAARALAHPWLAGLIIGLLLLPVLHPERVRAFVSAMAMLSFAPWLIVLRPIVPRPLRPWLWILAGVGILDILRQLTDEIYDINRAALLIEMLVLAIASTVLLRQHWLREDARRGKAGYWHRIFRRWLKLTVVAGLFAFGAGVLGYALLAERVASPVVWSMYVGGAWFAGVRILEGVVVSIVVSGRLDALNTLRNKRELALRWTRRTLRTSALLVWFSRVLVMARLWGPTQEMTVELLAHRLEFGKVSFSLGGVIGFCLTLWVSWTLSRLISFTANEEVFSRIRLAPGVPYALTTFTRYTIIVLGFLIAMAAVGLSVDRIALLISALGIGIGFGLQAIVNNFVSGVIVLFERPVRVGDLVQIDTLFGEVKDIGIRATKVRTFDGSDVLVPNGDLMSARLVNWTLSDHKRRVAIPIRAHFGTNPETVLDILKRAATEHEEVLDDPEPEFLFMGFGENGLEFELRTWTESPRGIFAVRSDLATRINELLAESGVEIPVPQRQVRIEGGHQPA